MTNRTRTTAAGLILAIALVAGQAALQARDEKTVAGTWTMTVDSPHGHMTMGLKLKQDGQTITGSFASPHGDVPIEGEFADRTLKLATASHHDADVMEIQLNAKLKDDGTLSGYLSSGMGDMMWTAQRDKE